MIRRGFAQGQAEEFFKGQPVIDLVFEFGIGIDIYPVEFEDYSTGAKPLLQQHAFKQQYGRVGVSPFAAGPYGVVTE